MDPSKVRSGEKLAAVAAVLLFIDMFMSWYGVDVSAAFGGNEFLETAAKSSGVDTTVSAWQAFDFVDIVLLITALAAAVVVGLIATDNGDALPIDGDRVIAGLGGLAFLLVAYRILNQPGPNDLIEVKWGAWLGVLLCAAVAFGGYRAMSEAAPAAAASAPPPPPPAPPVAAEPAAEPAPPAAEPEPEPEPPGEPA